VEKFKGDAETERDTCNNLLKEEVVVNGVFRFLRFNRYCQSLNCT
jgi:hypothetical protein